MLKLFPILFLSLSVSANTFFKDQNLVAARDKKIEVKEGPVLVVNIATECGYTPQLDGLEKVYKKYQSQGLTVIGVPSNDFLGQTPQNDEEVEKFCKLNYGASFPITKKAVVKGDEKISLIKKLIDQADEKGEIKWNFEKFLVSSDGKTVKRFRSGVKPEDKELTSAIEEMLKK